MHPLQLDPSESTQVDSRFLVLWDCADQTPRRGLLAFLSFCANAKCDCAEVRVRVGEIDERLVEVEYMDQSEQVRFRWSIEDGATPPIDFERAVVDMQFGDVDVELDETKDPPVLTERLRQALHAELIDDLFSKHLEAKRLRPRWARRLPPDYAPGKLLFRDEVYAGTRRHLLRLEGATVQASDLYCPVPECDCRTVRVLFERLESGSEPTPLGLVVVSTSDDREEVAWTFEPEPGSDPIMLEHAWANYHRGFRDVVDTLRAREDELRKQLRPLMKQRFFESTGGGLGDDPFVREEAKVGRNEPCPCGSGRKYKRCCAKTDASG